MKSQGSFDDLVSLTSKSDKMFGLDQKDYSLRPQKVGYLHMKPFSSSRTAAIGPMLRKRYFAVKDSFIFWWDSEWKSPDLGFDPKPRGAIPLGGATIRCLPDQVTLELRHPIFTKGEVLSMKASDPFEAQEWKSAITSGMQATWENAILGFALIDKLKAKGSELESEKEDALQQAQKEAERLNAEREEAQRVLNLKAQQSEMHEKAVEKVDTVAEDLKKKVSLMEEAGHKIEEEAEQERVKREELEMEMAQAQEALVEIEAIFESFEAERFRQQLQIEAEQREKLEQRQRAKSNAPPTPAEKAEISRQAQIASQAQTTRFEDEEQVRKNVAALRRFFEATARGHEIRRNGLQTKARQ